MSDTGGTGGGTIGSASYSTSLLLRDSTGTQVISFVMGEPIRFDLEIDNTANQAGTLQFSDAQIYDFYVLDADDSVTRWHWSQGMVFGPANSQLSFAAYGSKSYSIVWEWRPQRRHPTARRQLPRAWRHRGPGSSGRSPWPAAN